MNFCAVGQCYRRRARSARATKLCPVLHEDRGRSSTRSHSFRPRALPNCHLPRASRDVPPPETGTRCPTPGREAPACFRERIYISRNRLNFYTARRGHGARKQKRPLCFSANYRERSRGGGRGQPAREDKQSERERERKGRRVSSCESVCGFIASTTEEWDEKKGGEGGEVPVEDVGEVSERKWRPRLSSLSGFKNPSRGRELPILPESGRAARV